MHWLRNAEEQYKLCSFTFICVLVQMSHCKRDRHVRAHMVAGFTTTYVISAYHH